MTGIGIELRPAFHRDALARVAELGLHDAATFVLGDATAYASTSSDVFDVVRCLGASWMCASLPELLALTEEYDRYEAGTWLNVARCSSCGSPDDNLYLRAVRSE